MKNIPTALAETALRRLLADVEAARDHRCKVDGCTQYACSCCHECWAHETSRCPDPPAGMHNLRVSQLDYLERVAQEGLGEP